jgi:hypothetical protein
VADSSTVEDLAPVVGALVGISLLEQAQALDAVVGVNALNVFLNEASRVDDEALSRVNFAVALAQHVRAQDVQTNARIGFAVSYGDTVQARDVLSARFLWLPVDDQQAANWLDITDAQTPGWTNIADAQTPNWQDI